MPLSGMPGKTFGIFEERGIYCSNHWRYFVGTDLIITQKGLSNRGYITQLRTECVSECSKDISLPFRVACLSRLRVTKSPHSLRGRGADRGCAQRSHQQKPVAQQRFEVSYLLTGGLSK